jgi:hypothetical protein
MKGIRETGVRIQNVENNYFCPLISDYLLKRF